MTLYNASSGQAHLGGQPGLFNAVSGGGGGGSSKIIEIWNTENTLRNNTYTESISPTTYVSFFIPSDFTTLTSAKVWVKTDTATATDKNVDLEAKYSTSEGADTTETNLAYTKTFGDLDYNYEVDISSVLTGITADMNVGVELSISGMTSYCLHGLLEYS